ncbi:hypothetical protein MASR1M45_06050 [Candidatus Kapaibacterium sp.]
MSRPNNFDFENEYAILGIAATAPKAAVPVKKSLFVIIIFNLGFTNYNIIYNEIELNMFEY